MTLLSINLDKLITADHKFEERKLAKIQAIKDAGDDIMQIGFPFQGGHLQLRNNTDRTNWLTAMAGYQLQIATGQGDVKGASFRTAENETVALTFNEAVVALATMIGWADHLYRVSWAKQDQVRATTNDDELDAVSVTEGWYATA